ncbi:DNA-binding transcriptional regulator LsrR (DeoR family) [Haloactinopolyspora alba]|uniref:DNA-binding transcriptional regulator LsrR (DeoR family) n=2 Tax=Haloactinopolyspora alba TaxID=648780 RepID=A0A2P8DT15_9ACTN|nr:sugar-binding transcriptional regulator [Haloactinopolyspora alba]PSL00356.1 DNA-binding transcriptional regulator LsrR (DeoR family) [Haloactinopolyspora alba]
MNTRHAGHSGEQLRLMAKIARMYHTRGMRQNEIAAELHLSQARVSRLLKKATEVGIVRTTVSAPPGVHTELEEKLEQRFGLLEAVVVNVSGDEETAIPAIGAAASGYLENTLLGGEIVGISTWSANLLATVESMRPPSSRVVEKVVQLMGGMGDPIAQVEATRIMTAFSSATGADPIYLAAPCLLGSASARDTLSADPLLTKVTALWDELSTVLVGIGTLEPSPLLRSSGNAVDPNDQDMLRSLGAVGDVCMRFFDKDGNPVDSSLGERVIGIQAEQLRAVPRRIGVAGGMRKLTALHGALEGRWINVLITDVDVAHALLET